MSDSTIKKTSKNDYKAKKKALSGKVKVKVKFKIKPE